MNRTMKLEPESLSPPDLLVLLRTLWAGKWLIVGAITVALLLAAVYIFTRGAQYQATAILSLQGPEHKVVKFEGATEAFTTEEREKAIATEIRLLQSRGLARRLVEEHALADDPEFNPALQSGFSLFDWVRGALSGRAVLAEDVEPSPQAVLSATIDGTIGAISVVNVPDTFLVEVSIESASPEKAAHLTNGLVRLYVDMRLESQLEAAGQAADWLGQQVSQLKNNLVLSEERLKEFEAATRLISPEVLARQSVQMKELRDRHLKAQKKIDLSASRIAVLEELAQGATAHVTGTLAEDPVLAPLLYRGSSDSSKFDARAISRLLTKELSEKEQQMQFASSLSAAIADLENRIEHQSGELVKLQQLAREVQANAAVYEYALGRLKELAVERGIQQAGIQIVSAAEPPLMPSGPSSSIVAALAGALGFMVGIGLVLFRQRVQDVFRTVEDVERLSGVPVVGQVPLLPTRRRRSVMKHIESDDTSLFSEAIRNLRTSILSNHENRGKIIVLASALPGEGKTTQALALAHSLSLIGNKVLVIDADLRRRTLAKYFHRPDYEPGLAAVMLYERPFAEVVMHSETIGVDLLFSEKCTYNAADMFSFDGLRKLLDNAKQDYDVVIIDTPAALVVPDVRLIARFADMLLFVLQWNKTNRWQFLDAIREIETANITVNGCILSQVDPKGMSRYGYGDRRGALAAYRAGYFQ